MSKPGYFKKRRLRMKAMGICVDCQNANRPITCGHVLCITCRAKRRDREFYRQLRIGMREWALMRLPEDKRKAYLEGDWKEEVKPNE